MSPNSARYPDWPERLASFVDARRACRFAWGRHDCVTLAGDWVLEATGVDLLAELRGQWHSRRQADALLGSAGGLAMAVSNRLGERLRPAQLMRGDIVLGEGPDAEEFLGICLGEESVGVGRPVGVRLFQTMAAAAGWRI